jgi:LL-diaminopimelate aminotransferase
LNELNIVVTPEAGFGAQPEGFFRLSGLNSREKAEEAARRVERLR